MSEFLLRLRLFDESPRPHTVYKSIISQQSQQWRVPVFCNYELVQSFTKSLHIPLVTALN